MKGPGGEVYSSLDADSIPDGEDNAAREEGAFYLWTYNEIEEILGQEEARIFCSYYGITREGNINDSRHAFFRGRNVLSRLAAKSPETGVKDDDVYEPLISQGVYILKRIRNKRPRPALNRVTIASNAGMAISAFVKGYRVLGTSAFLEKAWAAYEFVKSNLGDLPDGLLYHDCLNGRVGVDGFCADYALMIHALLDLYDVKLLPGLLCEAYALAARMIHDFHDPINGGFYSAGCDAGSLGGIRPRQVSDGVIPMESCLAYTSLRRLYGLTGSGMMAEPMEKTRSWILSRELLQPVSSLSFLTAVLDEPEHEIRILLAGKRESPEAEKMIDTARSFSSEGVLLVSAATGEELKQLAPVVEGMDLMAVDGEKVLALVCADQTCYPPVCSSTELALLLKDIIESPNNSGSGSARYVRIETA